VASDKSAGAGDQNLYLFAHVKLIKLQVSEKYFAAATSDRRTFGNCGLPLTTAY
jgi:hypothetical protein